MTSSISKKPTLQQQAVAQRVVAQRAADYICGRWDQRPQYAIILGTGADQVAQQIEVEQAIDYGSIPGFPISTALGHRGVWICGRLADRPVVAMQGRFHLYEGYDFDIATLPIHVMNCLGIKGLIVSNASGGINPRYTGGQIMAIDSHLDLMLRSSSIFHAAGSEVINSCLGSPDLSGMDQTTMTSFPRPLFRSDRYDADYIDAAIASGRRHGFQVHRGVYAGVLGPNYETRAEYRFLRTIGADVVGMSTVPEVAVASNYGMRVLGLSIVANTANPDILAATSGQEVIDAAQIAAPRMLQIVTDLMRLFP